VGSANTADPAVRIVVVDDEEPIRRLLGRILEPRGFETVLVPDIDQALAAVAAGGVELVLCDVMMPGGSGINFLQRLRDVDAHVPVVMVSGMSDPEFADMALSLGADGYVTKPFDPNQVLIAAASAMRRGRLERENRVYRSHLEAMVVDRTAALSDALADLRLANDQLQQSAELTINALAQAIEGRDIETGNHVVRVSRYTNLLAHKYGYDADEAHMLGVASAMHDIGKVGVPDGILFKPGPFTAPEYDVIKQHAELGYHILSKSEQPMLEMAASIARSHHERWDGGGYPHGLHGDTIPIEGRIAAVADVFDAVVCRRCYKPAFPVERALEIVRDARGTHFDPGVVDVFFENLDAVLDIRNDYPDE
jgi:putative two-component system response regulator